MGGDRGVDADMNADLMRRLSGVKDSRGKIGIFSRGANIYNGGSKAAHQGGGVQFGRPRKEAIERRMRRR
jgi:hypothetical protein